MHVVDFSEFSESDDVRGIVGNDQCIRRGGLHVDGIQQRVMDHGHEWCERNRQWRGWLQRERQHLHGFTHRNGNGRR